jgi:hypothetical protein
LSSNQKPGALPPHLHPEIMSQMTVTVDEKVAHSFQWQFEWHGIPVVCGVTQCMVYAAVMALP